MTRLALLTFMLFACVARASQELPGLERIAIGRGCHGLRAGDFDGDGRQDLLVFAGSQRLLVIANGPEGFGAPIDTTAIGTLGDAGDLDGDGSLTIFDFLAFGNLFDLMDPRADFDGDGSFTLFDFLAFQNAFDAGCP